VPAWAPASNREWWLVGVAALAVLFGAVLFEHWEDGAGRPWALPFAEGPAGVGAT